MGGTARARRWAERGGTWATTDSLVKRRAGHTATKTSANGAASVVVAGSESGGEESLVEVFDEASETWSPLADLSTGRSRHAAARLADGRVLVAGGRPGGGGSTSSVEIVDVANGTITGAAPLPEATSDLTLSLLPDGKVLAAGGDGNVGAHAYLYDPATDTWATLTTPGQRFKHAAIAKGNDVYLLGGGEHANSENRGVGCR